MTDAQSGIGNSERGASLLEATIVCALLTALALVITESTTALSRTQKYHKTQMTVIDGADQLVRDVEWDARFAVKVFTDSADSRAYLNSLGIAETTILPGSLLPVITTRGYFDKDPLDKRETGNLLFVARSGDPLEVKLPDTVGGGVMRIDVRFFVLYFVKQTSEGFLDVVRWASAPLADHAAIAAIEDANRKKALLSYLREEGVSYTWDTEQERAEGLFQISESGQISVLPLSARLPSDGYQSRPSLLVQRKLQVARNGFLGAVRVPAFAKPGTSAFPTGFEVKIDGPETGKLLLIRLVAVPTQSHGLRNLTEAKHIFSCGGS